MYKTLRYINLSRINYSKILFLLTIAIFPSCESFVELELPDSQLNASEVFTDVQTAEAAIGELYSRLRTESILAGDSNGIGFLLGLYADELTNFNVNDLMRIQFYQNSVIPSNYYIENWWKSSYSIIYSCNSAIEALNESSGISMEDRDRLLGQAYFVRSQLYYYLTEIFGDIPYTVTTDYQLNTRIPKTVREELLLQITADLLQAEELLTPQDGSGERIFADKNAVQAALARVYLEEGRYEEAEIYASKLIENPRYSINEPLSKVFLKDSPSTIWQFKPIEPGYNTLEAMAYTFSTNPPPNIALSDFLLDSFEVGDLRPTEWMQEVVDSMGVFSYSSKYKLKEPTPISAEYSIIYRLAEQYLIRAEARFRLNDLEGSAEDLNVIRSRAGLPGLSSDQISKETLAGEWYHEFFLEFGHRFISLKRLGLADQILGNHKSGWNPEDKLLPIPEKEIVINPSLKPQNPGY